MTALLMVVLLGFAALSVDVGLLYHERAQLKNGADSGALAIAQHCADGACPADPVALATSLAGLNARDGLADADVALDLNAGTVTVETVTRTPGGHELALAFAPVLGIDSATVRSRSSAAWSAPVGGPNVLPIALSWCQYDGMLDGDAQLIATNPNNGENSDCLSTTIPGYTGTQHTIPGGFGWLDQTSPDTCSAAIDLTEDPIVGGDPGNNTSNVCKDRFEELIGETVLLPIYGDFGGTGDGGWYEIVGFAAFELQGWNFSGSHHNNTSTPALTCTGDCRGVIGRFVTFVSLDEAEQGYDFGPDGRDLGGRVVNLTE